MCDFGISALLLSAGSGLFSASAQAGIAKQNAAFARYEAAQTAEIGRANEMQARSKMGRLIAQQRGQLAANGVRLDSTSALDLGENAAKQSAMEGQAQRFNTATRVAAKTNEAAINDYQATTGMWNGVFQTGARALGQSLDLWPQLQGA